MIMLEFREKIKGKKFINVFSRIIPPEVNNQKDQIDPDDLPDCLIDTGATMSVIPEKILDELNIDPIPDCIIKFVTSLGEILSKCYSVKLDFLEGKQMIYRHLSENDHYVALIIPH